MDWFVALEPRVLADVIGGLALVLIALFVGYLDFESRLHRAFAVFLLFRGLATLGNGLVEVPSLHDYWSNVVAYFGLALPFALLHFVHVYRVTRLSRPDRPWVLPLLVGGALLTVGLYMADHGLFIARDAASAVRFGPLFLIVGVLYVLYALVARGFVRDFAGGPPSRREPSLLLIGVAFALVSLHTGVFYLFVILLPSKGVPGAAGGPPIAAIVVAFMFAASAFLVVPAARILWRMRATSGPSASLARGALALLAVPIGTALVVVAIRLVDYEASLVWVRILEAVWVIAFAALVAYAMLRHRLFDIDARVRLALRRSTLLGFFVTAYFATVEVAQTYFTNRFDWLVGGLITAGMFLAIAPLQRFARRVGEAAPATKKIADMSSRDRAELFRDQLRIAWADGSLTRKERRMLDLSRDRLGLGLDEAARLENEVVKSLGS